MEKNTSIVIKNNLIACAVHLCLSIVFAVLILGILPLFNATMLTSLLVSLPCGIIALYLYYLTGKRLMKNTKTPVTDYFSVAGFFILTAVLALLLGGLAIFPLWSIYWIVCESFQITYAPIEMALNNFAMASLPPLIIWFGLLAKRRKAGLDVVEPEEPVESENDEQFPNE